jgi:hypothetical protein
MYILSITSNKNNITCMYEPSIVFIVNTNNSNIKGKTILSEPKIFISKMVLIPTMFTHITAIVQVYNGKQISDPIVSPDGWRQSIG